jgi:hypothetical protein
VFVAEPSGDQTPPVFRQQVISPVALTDMPNESPATQVTDPVAKLPTTVLAITHVVVVREAT